MAKINVLNSTIFNRIAAGEVIERPFSVIKELVENSIDAGAKNIEIKIFSGGIEKIEISDDGEGIEKDELINAYFPHATSKISKLSDLDAISTLGFRGEAVASIASISKMKITSKFINDKDAYSLESNGGKLGEIQIAALEKGTFIEVNNLFFNTPVRAKFLKQPKSEEGFISNIISRFILGHPDLSFKYFSDNKLILQSFGDGEENALINVYGAEPLKNCFYINTIKHGIKIWGYIGNINFSKPNKSYQSLFVNGRYVVNNTISSAITNAYSSYLMKRQYPFYVLKIDLSTEFVDVNVHPNKTDVRFVDNQIMYGSIYSVISSILDGKSSAINMITNIDNQKYSEIENLDLKKINAIKEEDRQAVIKNKDFLDSQPYEAIKIEQPEIKVCDHTYYTSNTENFNKTSNILENNDYFLENKKYLENIDKEVFSKNVEIEKINLDEIPFYKIIGQIFSTYIILQIENDVILLIDQHAAHEKLLFDELNNKLLLKEMPRQQMLLPYILEVNYLEFDFLKQNKEIISDLGIDITEFGKNSYKISEIPTILSEMNLKDFFDDIKNGINDFNKKNSIYIKEKIAQIACKSAIKAGKTLNENEIKCLLKQINGNFELKCPHGRPVCVKISKMEIEKWFKRIV